MCINTISDYAFMLAFIGCFRKEFVTEMNTAETGARFAGVVPERELSSS
jgi:hypothetical protein